MVGGANHDLTPGTSDILLRDHEATGDFLWEDNGGNGRIGIATDVVADPVRVFVGGLRERSPSPGFDGVFGAHEGSGRLLWEKDLGRQITPIPRPFELPSAETPLCLTERSVITTGFFAGEEGSDLTVTAYDTRPGRVRWEDRLPNPGEQ